MSDNVLLAEMGARTFVDTFAADNTPADIAAYVTATFTPDSLAAELADRESIWLGVWERNPRGIAFYRKWGFERVGTQPFQLGGNVQTDWLMARPVDPTTI